MKKPALPLAVLAALLALPAVAQAHPGHGLAQGFAPGFAHPLLGLDHELAMIAIGLWAAQAGGRALWAVPATFVGVMALGGALGMAHVSVPFIEPGIAASVLVVLGLGMAIVGFVGRGYVLDALADEQIVGTPDMTTDATAAAIKEAGLTGVSAPSCSVAGEEVDTGSEAKCFADYMRVHALEATAGKTYSQMPQYATDDGKGTSDKAAATKGENGAPVSNPARQIWVTETALTTALNMSYFAERVGVFGIVMGIALLLTGIGFLVLTLGGLEQKSVARQTAPKPAPAAS